MIHTNAYAYVVWEMEIAFHEEEGGRKPNRERKIFVDKFKFLEVSDSTSFAQSTASLSMSLNSSTTTDSTITLHYRNNKRLIYYNISNMYMWIQGSKTT